MNQTTNTNASIDLAQLDSLPTYDPERDTPGMMELRSQFNDGDYFKVEDVRELARRSLTSGTPDQASPWFDSAMDTGVIPDAAPVHDAAAPSAYHGHCSICVNLEAQLRAAVHQRDEALAGAAAKTDHAQLTCKNCHTAKRENWDACPECGGHEFAPWSEIVASIGRASAAGAGSDQAPVCEHCGRAPGERRDECENCPASVTVQDERALREAVCAVVQLVQNGEWADLLHTDPDAVALWDAVDGLLRRAAHPVQDGEKDAMTQAARDVLAERRRQVEQEGWTPGHDDVCINQELRAAALCYMRAETITKSGIIPGSWPWPAEWWKPTTDRRNLIKATALMLAEIERLDRAAMAAAQQDAKGGA